MKDEIIQAYDASEDKNLIKRIERCFKVKRDIKHVAVNLIKRIERENEDKPIVQPIQKNLIKRIESLLVEEDGKADKNRESHKENWKF